MIEPWNRTYNLHGGNRELSETIGMDTIQVCTKIKYNHSQILQQGDSERSNIQIFSQKTEDLKKKMF